MNRETIYLDNDEEVTSVVDKLKGAETTELDLVIPKEALILQSVVNLKLLKRQAEILGKEITIVTQDKVGKKLAAQIGIPVIEKVGEVPKEVKMSEADPISEKDIEFKEELDSQKAETEVKKENIEFKQQADSALEPTNEVITPRPEKIEELSELPRPEKVGKKKKWKRYALTSGFLIVALSVLAYIYVPLATLTVKVAAEKEKVDFTFTADKSATELKTDSQTLPAREISVEVEKAEKFKATGKKKVGTKAKGTATLYNNGFDSDPITIVAGTRLLSGNLVFKTTANVTLPGSYLNQGQIVVTAVDVIAEAEEVGGNYNIASGSDLSVPALGTPKLYAKSKTAFSGGEAKDVVFVTQADVNTAKENLTKIIAEELKAKVGTDLKDGERFIEESLKVSEITASPSVAINGEAEEFELKAKASVKAIAFKEEDLKRLAENVLGDKIGPAKEIVESGSLLSSTDHISTDIEKGEMTARLSGEAFIATKIDEEKIKTEIVGDSEAKLSEYFNRLDGIDALEVKFFPRFYKRVPRVKKHIYIKTTINKVQEEVQTENAD